MDRQIPGGSTTAPATDMQKALLSIRQARDSVLAQNHELISKLATAQEQLSVTTVEKEAGVDTRASIFDYMYRDGGNFKTCGQS